MSGKKNWRTVFYMAVLIACSASSVQSAARWFTQYSKDDSDFGAAEKAGDVVNKATGAAEKAADAVENVTTGAAEKAADAVENVTTGAAEKAADAVENVTTGVAEKAADAVENVTTGAAEKAADAVEKAVTGAAEKAEDAVEKAATGAAEKAADAVEKAATGAAEKAADAVENVTTGAAEKAADAVENVTTGAADKAADAVENVTTGAADKAANVVNKATAGAAEKAADAVHKAVSGAVEKAADATDLSFQGAQQSRELLLENQKTLFKDYDLDKLLHNIKTVLEHNSLQNVQKQFHQLFDKQGSSVYSCAFESAVGDENLKEMHKDMKQIEDHLQEARKFLEKTHGTSIGIEPQQGQDIASLSSQELYKKGYDALLSAHYVDAEKAFCVFQQRYQKDPLNDDALFWLAEALLGQKRYHEAAQVYLNVWYADKKKAYTSEILLKLARIMVALEPNKQACALSAQKEKYSKSLESIFCKPLKRSEVIHGVH
ncbi:hypothetical protein [Bartonella pachyuromydis]